MVTIKEIAKLAGASRGTVDRVLHDRPGVRAELRDRIWAIAKEQGYQPNRAGKALVMREPLPIGVVLNALDNPFFEQVIAGIRAGVKEYQDFPIRIEYIPIKGYHPDDQLRAMEEMAKRQVRGLILSPMDDPSIGEKIDQLVTGGTPIVTVNSDHPHTKRLCYVGCDYVKSGQTAAQLMGLITGGKCHVLAVTGSLRMLGHRQRMDGFVKLMADSFAGSVTEAIVQGNDDDQTAYQAVRQALKEHPSINAVYFGAAGTKGGMEALRQGNYTVITSDMSPFVREEIEQGRVQATICQQPALQGLNSFKALMNYVLFQQQPPSPFIYTQSEIKLAYNC